MMDSKINIDFQEQYLGSYRMRSVLGLSFGAVMSR